MMIGVSGIQWVSNGAERKAILRSLNTFQHFSEKSHLVSLWVSRVRGITISERAILVYILALPGLSSKSIIRGRGYLSFFMILFSPWKSTQSRRPPSFFLTNRTGAPCGDRVELIKPVAKFSSKNSRSAFNSVCDNE